MQAKWAAMIVALCVVVTVAAVAYAAGKVTSEVPEVIRAQRFEVVDGQGKARAALAMASDGGAHLVFADDQGKTLVNLVTGGGRPTLWLFDGKGTDRVVLGLAADVPSLALSDASGGHRVLMTATAEMPGMIVYDQQGIGRVVVGTTDDLPMLGIFDKRGELLWSAQSHLP